MTFSLSFPGLKSSCRPKITRINNSRYYPGKATSLIQTTRRLMRWLMRRPTAIGRFSISYRWSFIWLKKFVLCFVGKLTYHKCSFTFPLLIIQIRTQKRAFFSLSCHKPHSYTWSDNSDESLLSEIAIHKLSFNWSWLGGWC